MLVAAFVAWSFFRLRREAMVLEQINLFQLKPSSENLVDRRLAQIRNLKLTCFEHPPNFLQTLIILRQSKGAKKTQEAKKRIHLIGYRK